MSQKNEISQLPDGRTARYGEKISADDPVMKKLDFLQEKILEMEERLEKIEQNTRSPGGSQPRSKFTTEALFTEKSGQKVVSELGSDILDWFDMDGNNQMDKNEFKDLMRKHGWTAGSGNTYRNWMEKVAGYFDRLDYKVGKAGGSNKPLRIIHKEEW